MALKRIGLITPLVAMAVIVLVILLAAVYFATLLGKGSMVQPSSLDSGAPSQTTATCFANSPSDNTCVINSATEPLPVKTANVTVSHDTTCMVLYAVGHTCPTVSANTNSSSLRGVQLVAYQGRNYYAGNFTEGPY